MKIAHKSFLLAAVIILFLVVASFAWSQRQRGDGDTSPKGGGDIRWDDPDLVYASKWWAGLCGKNGVSGGCASSLYLFASGKVQQITVFQAQLNAPALAPQESLWQLSPATFTAVKEKIQDSGILSKPCPTQTIMDAGWDYKIVLQGTAKTFRNPPQECRDIFSAIDDMIQAAK